MTDLQNKTVVSYKSKKTGDEKEYVYARPSRLLSPEEGVEYYSALYPGERILFNAEYGVFVSDQGRVFSRSKIRGEMHYFNNIHGYVGFRQTTVHKLVMKTFGMYREGYEIDHINGDRTDNRLCNLRCVTHAENIRLRDINGAPMQGRTGSSHPRSKPVLQFDLDNNLIKEWESGNLAAKELGMAQEAICACCKGKPGHKTHGGFIWRYKEEA